MGFSQAGLYEGVLIGAGWCDLSKDQFPGILLAVEAQCQLERTESGFISHPVAAERGEVRCYLAYKDKRTGADVPNNISLRQIADVIVGFDPSDAEDKALIEAVGTPVRFMVEEEEYQGRPQFKVREVRSIEWTGDKAPSMVTRSAPINAAIRRASDIIATSTVQFKPANAPRAVAPRQPAQQPIPGTEAQPDHKAQALRIVELVKKWAAAFNMDLGSAVGQETVAKTFMNGRKLKSIPPAEYHEIESALIAAIDGIDLDCPF